MAKCGKFTGTFRKFRKIKNLLFSAPKEAQNDPYFCPLKDLLPTLVIKNNINIYESPYIFVEIKNISGSCQPNTLLARYMYMKKALFPLGGQYSKSKGNKRLR